VSNGWIGRISHGFHLRVEGLESLGSDEIRVMMPGGRQGILRTEAMESNK